MRNKLVGCPYCDSKDLKVIEGHVEPRTKTRVNELWLKCQNCGRESPVLQEEIGTAKELQKSQKESE